jgi:hypothetical protein
LFDLGEPRVRRWWVGGSHAVLAFVAYEAAVGAVCVGGYCMPEVVGPGNVSLRLRVAFVPTVVLVAG